MRSPQQLSQRLRRQWFNGELRCARLLDAASWPLRLAIGRPKPHQLQTDLGAVRTHLEAWRQVRIGTLEWGEIRYQSLSDPVSLPLNWCLHSAQEWVDAMRDADIVQEYRLLQAVLRDVDAGFHEVLIRQRQMLLSRDADELILACRVAAQLSPGMARGRPLRALSVAAIDSKFLQRNRGLLLRLLQQRFDEDALAQGLEGFLDAQDEAEHWLLVAPLSAGLLPFEQLRLRSRELQARPLPGSHLVIVENERSLYQLPPLADAVAVLGAGLNLGWMENHWLSGKALAYWGDMDTWGLSMLARARSLQPALTAMLMEASVFQAHAAAHAVSERVHAGTEPPPGLSSEEQAFYRGLLHLDRGRLEQEFLPIDLVHRALRDWHGRRAAAVTQPQPG